MSLKIHTARKDYTCSECGRKIPIGVRYWRDYEEDPYKNIKTHTNCLDFEDQPETDITGAEVLPRPTCWEVV